MLNALLTYFIPPHLRDDLDTYRRARLTVLYPLVGGIAAFYILPVYKLGYLSGAALLSLTFAINLLSPWMLRWTGSVALTGNVLAGNAFVVQTFFVLTGGGPTGVLTTWLVVAPIIALLLAGKQSSLIWVLLVLTEIVVLFALERSGVIFPDFLSGYLDIPITILLHLGFTVGIYILMRLIENGKDHALVVLSKARREAEAAMRSSQEMAEMLQAQNARIEDQARQLRVLDEAKSRFFANASHELRTPLTLIVGPLEQLVAASNDRFEPDVREQLAMMQRNGQRLLRLVNQILDLTKLEAGGLVLDRRWQNLVAFVRQHVRLYEGLATYEGVDLSFHADVPTCVIPFDAEQFEKVLANLISNALKFTDAGGRVSVRVQATSDAAAVVVEDTGAGIAVDQLGGIFGRFYQAEDSATRTHEGTGIGLALVRELVTLHGGDVHVESELGRGSTFTVRLPKGDPAGETSASGEEVNSAGGRERYRLVPRTAPEPDADDHRPAGGEDRTTILIVEDNADMRAFIRSILAPAYRVLEAADGEAGFQTARTALPDLILADVMMPTMDGLAMGRALREDPTTGSIPLVLLTARAALDDRIAGLETGADAYLVKPFDAKALRLQVGNLIARQHRLRDGLNRERAPIAMPTTFEARVREVIEQHLSDPQFSVEVLAEEVALSRQQLYRRLRDETGTTPVAYIRKIRLDRSAVLLRERRGNVSEVAYAVGFNSLSYFSSCFHQHFGKPPTSFLLNAPR